MQHFLFVLEDGIFNVLDFYGHFFLLLLFVLNRVVIGLQLRQFFQAVGKSSLQVLQNVVDIQNLVGNRCLFFEGLLVFSFVFLQILLRLKQLPFEVLHVLLPTFKSFDHDRFGFNNLVKLCGKVSNFFLKFSNL